MPGLTSVTAIEPDNGDSLVYGMIVGDATRWLVNNATGEVTLRSSGMLDFETNKTYAFMVEAVDRSLLRCNATVIVSVLDVNEPPWWVSTTSNFTVGRNPLIGTVVGNVTARDFENSVRYSIASQNVTGMFAVSATTGVITVAAFPLLIEQPAVFAVTLVATEVRCRVHFVWSLHAVIASSEQGGVGCRRGCCLLRSRGTCVCWRCSTSAKTSTSRGTSPSRSRPRTRSRC